MIRLVVGFVFGVGLSTLTARPRMVVCGLEMGGLALQVVYARRLSRFLGGVDPVKLGARSFGQLKSIGPVPVPLSVLEFSAKVALWGAAAGFLAAFGWIRFE